LQAAAATQQQLAHTLAVQEAAKLAEAGAAANGKLVTQLEKYQGRILELEAQVATQAKAINRALSVSDTTGERAPLATNYGSFQK
jgi:hypothetical protein